MFKVSNVLIDTQYEWMALEINNWFHMDTSDESKRTKTKLQWQFTEQTGQEVAAGKVIGKKIYGIRLILEIKRRCM